MEINEASLRELTETQIPSFNTASLKYRETATAGRWVQDATSYMEKPVLEQRELHLERGRNGFTYVTWNFEQKKKIRTTSQVKTMWPKVIHWSSQPAFIHRPHFNLGRHKGQANFQKHLRSELILLSKQRSDMVMYVTRQLWQHRNNLKDTDWVN